MSRRTAARVAWGLFAFDVLTVAFLVPFGAEEGDEGSTVAGVIFIVAFATTGALVASRRPGNPIGWLLCLSAFAFSIGAVCVGISAYAVEDGRDDLPVARAAAWVGLWVWMAGVGPAATFLLLLFPDGKLPSRRWRPIAWLAGGSLVVTLVALALMPGRIEDTLVTNPLGISGATKVLDAFVAAGFGLLFVSIVASCASLVVRYRSAGQSQRLQLKWVAYSLPLVLVCIAASGLVESAGESSETSVELANILSSTGLVVVPIAIGIAMLRHRLYDIDVVINRTLVYGSLTATLAAVYLALVLILQVLLNPMTEQSDLAVAASTLAVAALFRPVRSRIQGGVDRRFYRARYDSARTLENFSSKLRDEIDLEALAINLRSVVSQTVQPAHVSLWLREGER